MDLKNIQLWYAPRQELENSRMESLSGKDSPPVSPLVPVKGKGKGCQFV